MRDPTRWLNSTDTPADVREILELAERSGRVPADVDHRVARRLLAGGIASAGLLGGLLTAKAMGVAAAVTVVTVGAIVVAPHVTTRLREPKQVVEPRVVRPTKVHEARQTARSEPPRPVATSVPRPKTRPPAALPPRVATRARAKGRAAARLPIGEAEPSALLPSGGNWQPQLDVSAPGFAAETALLEQARAAASVDPARSLALLDRYDRDFPTGQLRLERELIGLDALKRLGRHRVVRKLARRFLARHGRSPYADRVRALLNELDRSGP